MPWPLIAPKLMNSAYGVCGVNTATRARVPAVALAIPTPMIRRRFDEHAACRVKVARVAQRVGLSIKEISEALDGLGAKPSLEDWQRVHTTLVTDARRRINELSAALADIQSGRKMCDL